MSTKCSRCGRNVEERFGVVTREIRISHMFRCAHVLCDFCLQRLADTVKNFLDKKAKTY